MAHKCDALLVTCIDYRFQRYVRNWTDDNLKKQTFDLVGYAGSTKDLKTILKQIAISVRLHHTKQIILIHHEDCGAYGDKSTPETHKNDLTKARKEVLAIYPNVTVSLYYLRLDGVFERIN